MITLQVAKLFQIKSNHLKKVKNTTMNFYLEIFRHIAIRDSMEVRFDSSEE
jgi:hypothetical protein